MDYIDERIETFCQRVDALATRMGRCRHCGRPVELGIDGALLNARLGFDDTIPLPYAAHLVCQVRALEQMAAANQKAAEHWKLTAAGAIVLAATRTREYLDSPTVEAAVAMESAIRLGEDLDDERGDGQ